MHQNILGVQQQPPPRTVPQSLCAVRDGVHRLGHTAGTCTTRGREPAGRRVLHTCRLRSARGSHLTAAAATVRYLLPNSWRTCCSRRLHTTAAVCTLHGMGFLQTGPGHPTPHVLTATVLPHPPRSCGLVLPVATKPCGWVAPQIHLSVVGPRAILRPPPVLHSITPHVGRRPFWQLPRVLLSFVPPSPNTRSPAAAFLSRVPWPQPLPAIPIHAL